MRRTLLSRALHTSPKTMNQVRNGERVLLVRRGKPVAALISLEDLALLRRLEDRYDAEMARAILVEVEREGTVSWIDLKASLGL